ncbi:DNA polymerase III subunit delta [Rudaea sp.]|uniref:DNA polymerase III subunit delta n=1 Tax=Rudaea sp. TaxID=2136325 RepID=UPI00321FBD2D
MPTPLTALRKQIATGELKPVYLLAGEEHLLVLEAADALRARARELGYVEREVFDVDTGFDWNQLAQSASAMSLFATRKLIDLRMPTGKPGKEGAAAIGEYCANPPPDTVLLITAQEWSKKHEGAWSQAVDRAGALTQVWPLKVEELPKWIEARAAARGLKMAPDAVELLVERIEGNLLAAAQEIDKLALLHAGKTLDAAMLEASVADDTRFDVFKLLDAALAGDAARALRILAGLRAEGENPIGLLGWPLNQLQMLARIAGARGGIAAGLKSEYIRPPQREGLIKRALERVPRAHWNAYLIQAGRIERIGKGRERDADGGKPMGDAWLEFERLLVAIAQPRAGLLAKAG